MKRIFPKTMAALWTRDLLMLAVALFVMRFGEGILGGARTNFFVDTLHLSGGQVLQLEGIREIPGLFLILIAAAVMHLPLSYRAGASVLLMGVGYVLFAFVQSFTALLVVAVIASLGMHMWMPLNSSLAMCLATKETSGRVMGTMASVSALASIVGMGAIALVSSLASNLSLRAYYVIGGILILVAGGMVFRLSANIGATEREQPRMLVKRRYWLYYVLTFFQGSRKQVLNTFGVLFLVDIFKFQVWQVSLLLLASAALNLVAAPVLGYMVDRFGERNTLATSYALLFICCLGFAFLHHVWLLIVLLMVIKLLVVLGFGLETFVNRMAPPEELTPTLAAGISINHVTSVAMPIVAGIVLPFIGYEGVFLGTAALILLSIPFALAMRIPKEHGSTLALASAEPAE